MSQQVAERRTKVGFVFSDDPDPLLIERMRALEESGEFESHAIYWHRMGSDLSFPFSPEPFDESRFTKIDLPDPRKSGFQRATLTLRFSRAIRKWWNRHRFKVLHVVYPNMLIATKLAMVGQNIPLVYDIWDVPRDRSASRLEQSACRILLGTTPHVFTTSQAFIDEYLIPNDLLPNDTSATNISNAPYDRESIAKADRGETLVVGCIGNLRVHKQLSLLVQAVAEVRTHGHDVRVRLSGAGSKKQLVESLTGDHRFVEYTGPYDYRHDAPKLYSKLDLVFAVYPLEIYNYRVHVARRLHDAVLSETPVIVSANSEMSNIVESEGIGWAVGHESLDDLVQVILSVCQDRSLLDRCIQQTRGVRSQHCFEGYRDRYLDAYRRLVS